MDEVGRKRWKTDLPLWGTLSTLVERWKRSWSPYPPRRLSNFERGRFVIIHTPLLISFGFLYLGPPTVSGTVNGKMGDVRVIPKVRVQLWYVNRYIFSCLPIAEVEAYE